MLNEKIQELKQFVSASDKFSEQEKEGYLLRLDLLATMNFGENEELVVKVMESLGKDNIEEIKDFFAGIDKTVESFKAKGKDGLLEELNNISAE